MVLESPPNPHAPPASSPRGGNRSLAEVCSARAGYTVALSEYVVEHTLATGNVVDVIRHQLRWVRGARISRPWGYWGFLCTYGTVTSLLFLATTRSAFGWAVVGVTWSARLTMGGVIGARYLNDQSAKKFLWLVPVRDLIDCVFWCCGILGNTIYWRGQRFSLAKGGKLVLLSAPGSRERFAEK